MVLAVDAGELGPELKWEPSRGGDLFPHLYGALALESVHAVWAAPLDAAGIPRLGDLPP
jgi:uncharacterized protein (DUF952 family)